MVSVSPCRISCLRIGADVWVESDVEAVVDVDVDVDVSDVCLESKRANSSFFFVEHPLIPASLQRVISSARDFLE